MKKVILMLFAMALAFCGCKDDSYESANYVGNYSGTFTILKQNFDENDNPTNTSTSTKSGKMIFTQNPINKENLLWYGIEMLNTSSGVYETSPNSATSELIAAAANLINIGDYTDKTIEKMRVKATFNGSAVEMKIYYTAIVLGMEMDVVIATFNGTK